MKTISALLLCLCCTAGVFAKEVVIDVRTPQEYAASHVDGAINIEYGAIAQQIFKAGVTKDDKVILYCRTGHRSGIALNTLKDLGYSKAENAGGIDQARKLLHKP